MKIVNLIFLIDGEKILLAMKKRGFGIGKWNGYGGKLEEGETVTEAAVREVKEEAGVDITESDLEHSGTIDFYFDDKPEWNQRGEIYTIEKWMGEPQETEEMKPAWFSFEQIPYSEMWVGDDQWLPYLLRGEHFTGEAHFVDGGAKLVSMKIFKK